MIRGCAPKGQIEGLKTISGDDPIKVPGYERISNESREQLKLAMEQGKIPDKEFKDIRLDLVKSGGGGFTSEITDAVGYKVDVAKMKSGCRSVTCKSPEAKILKGELRLGILRSYDGDHESYVYKHW